MLFTEVNTLARNPQAFGKLFSLSTQYAPSTQKVVEEWVALVAESESLSIPMQLSEANNFFNQHIHFQSDIEVWRQADYWATPLDTVSVMAGDCEDFAIAKYVTLLEMGVPEEMLRLVYVQISLPDGPQAHMVLAVYLTPAEEPLLLDNIDFEIKSASKRPDLIPIYSFNASSLWVGGDSRSKGDAKSRLSKWQDVLDRIKKHGFLDSPSNKTREE